MNISKLLKNNSIVIVTHEYTTGPPHSLEKYCSGKVSKLLFISHPFIFAPDTRSYFNLYDFKGKVQDSVHFIKFIQNQFISVMKDIVLTVYWVVCAGQFDQYIGVDGMNAFTGLFLKRLGIVKRVIFYTIDYVPNRFNNAFVDSIYLWIDKKAVEGSDVVWNLSDTMKTMRAEQGLSHSYDAKQILVPVGTDVDIPEVKESERKRFHVAHMGHLTKKQGVQLVIEAIPEVLTKVPEFHFDIFGAGEYEKTLKELSARLNVDSFVTFHGYIEDHHSLEIKLSTCSLGIAPYVDTQDNFIRHTDPGKVKAYLAAGLPIVITKVPDVWKDIEKNKCGKACEANPSSVAKTIIFLLTDELLLGLYRKNAVVYARKFSWKRVFTRAFQASNKIFSFGTQGMT
ncbi:glycosyltransferase [Candidatus Gottesmanbacteria bacterium]|nr:glycosyltransferase [Candidatus Gottesmanbacteria bacterium]